MVKKGVGWSSLCQHSYNFSPSSTSSFSSWASSDSCSQQQGNEFSVSTFKGLQHGHLHLNWLPLVSVRQNCYLPFWGRIFLPCQLQDKAPSWDPVPLGSEQHGSTVLEKLGSRGSRLHLKVTGRAAASPVPPTIPTHHPDPPQQAVPTLCPLLQLSSFFLLLFTSTAVYLCLNVINCTFGLFFFFFFFKPNICGK